MSAPEYLIPLKVRELLFNCFIIILNNTRKHVDENEARKFQSIYFNYGEIYGNLEKSIYAITYGKLNPNKYMKTSVRLPTMYKYMSTCPLT